MDGVLVIDKPQGLTSHDVVAAARRVLREKRIGHTGTLDPMATGVLPLACGRATRLVRFLAASDKDYDASIVLGLTTDTYDTTGAETSRTDVRPDDAALRRAIQSLSGSYLQVPPAYSAKKVGGRRAYDLARRAEAVELAPVPVTVTRATLEAFDGEVARVTLTCSAGFYVRAFAHALGELVGTGACLAALRRTRSGEFDESQAVTLGALIEEPHPAELIVPMARLLSGLPSVRLDPAQRIAVGRGQELMDAAVEPGAAAPPAAAGWVRLLDATGDLVALATPGRRPGSLHPAIVLT